ncbi:hypothetical protein HF086_015280, partial [Spodoptera exigua]
QYMTKCLCSELPSPTESIEELSLEYEDDRNAMIAVAEKGTFELTNNIIMYEEFYDELDNRLGIEQSMNMIFFGPPSSFLRLDPDSILHILTQTKKHMIPIGRTLLAWDIVTDGKTAAFLQGREYLAFGSLLNVVPEEDLYYVNFGDPSVLNYFGSHYIKLQPRKALYSVAIHRDAYGEPYKWSSHEIGRLSALFTSIPKNDISSIEIEAVAAITPEVMTAMNMEKLEYFTKQQVLRMNPKSRRIYILRMQLKNTYRMNDVARPNNCETNNLNIVLPFALIIVTLTHFTFEF